jgi:predicted amidohydrolase YtcJ
MIRPDLVLHRGNVVTLDPALHIAEAIAITGDRIAEVGATRDIRRLVGADTRLIDLAGRTVVPGLVDAHAHMDREGLKLACPTLAGARSIDDVLQRIESLVKAAAPGDWIVTMPLGDPPYYLDVPGSLREKRFPTRRDLDRVAPRNPVYIRSIWGYWRHTLPLVSVANSEALRLAGITHSNRYLYKEGDLFRTQVGSAAEDTIVPLRRLKAAGVHVALATDNVPPSLFWPVWQAVALVGRVTNRVVAPAQRLSRADALRAATLEGAYLTFEENQKGSIEPGKLADLAVLSEDPLTCAEVRIRDITADITIVGGRVVHERGRNTGIGVSAVLLP